MTAAVDSLAADTAVRAYVDAYTKLRAELDAEAITYDDYVEALKPQTEEVTDRLREVLTSAHPDPWDRAQFIASRIVPAQDAIKDARPKRDRAALSLVRQGWPPVKAYNLIGVSRGLFVRTRKKAEKAEAAGEPFPKIRNAEAVAKAMTAVIAENEPIVEAWRPIRDETVHELLETRPDLSNVDIGRLFGVQGQRITMMRTQGR